MLFFSMIVAILESHLFSCIDSLSRFDLQSIIAIFSIPNYSSFYLSLMSYEQHSGPKQVLFDNNESAAFDDSESAEVRAVAESLSVGQQQEDGISIGNFCG